jgi:hypothetical protein
MKRAAARTTVFRGLLLKNRREPIEAEYRLNKRWQISDDRRMSNDIQVSEKYCN